MVVFAMQRKKSRFSLYCVHMETSAAQSFLRLQVRSASCTMGPMNFCREVVALP